MPTLTATTTFTLGAGSPASETLDISILPAATGTSGRGRLIHPTLGVIDYEQSPDEWRGIDSDVLMPPVWASTKTLSGAANTLWRGNLRDGSCSETWTAENGLSMPLGQLRLLLAAWQNPIDPGAGFLQWWPNYTSVLGYKVLLTDVSVGGQGVTLDYLTRQGWVAAPVTVTYRIAGRV